jgi:hypothetical protein
VNETLDDFAEDDSVVLFHGITYYLIIFGRKHSGGEVYMVRSEDRWDTQRGYFSSKYMRTLMQDQDTDGEIQSDVIGLGAKV